MHSEDIFDFSNLRIGDQPFRFFSQVNILKNNLDLELFDWFEFTNAWRFTETDFYTQYEFSLFDVELPENLKSLISEPIIKLISEKFHEVYKVKSLKIVGITAHKLIDGYKIGVHNDYIGEEETHRLIIQINSNWKEENGGYIMLFKSSNVNDIDKIIIPANNTAIGFEISNKSYHAVSKVHNFSRYTVVYTFKNN